MARIKVRRDDIVGVVLAGGRSTRMGRDKTLLTWPPGVDGGKSLWSHAFDRLEQVSEDVVLADAGRCLAPESVTDGPGRGPVAGVLGAADARPRRPLLVLAADLPLVPVDLLRFLVDVASESDADWVVPSRERGLEPLCSVFGSDAVETLRVRAESGVFDLHGLAAVSGLRIRQVGDEDLGRFGEPSEAFLNVNRVEDWSQVEALHTDGSDLTSCKPEP